MSYRLKQVLDSFKKMPTQTYTSNAVQTPPPLPKKLPKLIALLTKNVPDQYKPAVASAVFPALAIHLHGVKFRYWDNVDHEATFMNVLVGRQSIGKGSIKKPIEYILADIIAKDQPSRMREAEWKRKNPTAKAKEKDPRPTDICIQVLIDNLTDAVFNQRIVDAHNNGERYIYTNVDEVEAMKNITSKNSVDEVLLLIRKAYDNALAGQERVGADSVSGIAPLRWNWNASTTPPRARKFFRNGVNDGTLSRLDFATIVFNSDEEYNDFVPIIGLYDENFAAKLRPYIQRLENANGLIQCKQSNKLALQMRKENLEKSQLYDSNAYLVLSFRANVIAWLKGMLLYVAEGGKWSKEIAEFVQWSQDYNLWCKMLYFGAQLEQELQKEDEIQRSPGVQNMLTLLPKTFTNEAYYLLRQQLGKKDDHGVTLKMWRKRGYVVWDDIGNCWHNSKSMQT